MAATNDPTAMAISDRRKTPSLTGKQQRNVRVRAGMFDQQTMLQGILL
jgi:hypothetical protein